MSKPTLSPTVDARLIARHFRPDQDDAVLQAMFEAAKLARDTGDRARSVTDTVMKNTLATEAARHRQARQANWRLTEKATAALDEARKAAVAEVNGIKDRLHGPTPAKDLLGETRQRELRERLSLMPAERRSAILQEAVSHDDDQLLAAVLGAPAWLTNMSTAELDLVRHNWAKRRYPQDHDRLQRLEAAIGDIEKIGTLLLGFVEQLTDRELVEEADRSEQAAREALKTAAGT